MCSSDGDSWDCVLVNVGRLFMMFSRLRLLRNRFSFSQKIFIELNEITSFLSLQSANFSPNENIRSGGRFAHGLGGL